MEPIHCFLKTAVNGHVYFTLEGGGDCLAGYPRVLCISDGRDLSNTVEVEIMGPTSP